MKQTEDRRCLVVDEHPVVRMGVRGLLDGRYEVEEADGWRGALEAQTQTGTFDVAVVELDCHETNGDRGGATVIRALRKAMPGTGIVAHARRAERHAAREAVGAGARAFVAKSSPPETLAEAIEVAAANGSYIDPAANGSDITLTKRQRQTLQGFADGQSSTEIADRFGLSIETVRVHTKGALRRLKASGRSHAVAIALRSGLID